MSEISIRIEMYLWSLTTFYFLLEFKCVYSNSNTVMILVTFHSDSNVFILFDKFLFEFTKFIGHQQIFIRIHIILFQFKYYYAL